MKKRFSLALFLITLFAVSNGSNLTVEDKRKLLDSLESSHVISTCCGTTLNKCLAKPECEIAPRLHAFSTWLIELERLDRERILEFYIGRISTLTHDDSAVTIDTIGWPSSGERDAPVVIVGYFSASCPLCKYVYRELHSAITSGSLKGKAILISKPFGLGVGDFALMSAHTQNKFSEFMLALAADKRRPTQNSLLAIADTLGIDTNIFTAHLTDSTLKARILESRSEAERYDVQVTPTFFINGQRYLGFKDPQWVIDALEHIASTPKQ